VDDRRASRFRLHDPLKADRVALGHIRAFDDNAIAIGQILKEVGGTAATE
jgi:hypothetical protein